jgi:peptide/nickel transport system permease protein
MSDKKSLLLKQQRQSQAMINFPGVQELPPTTPPVPTEPIYKPILRFIQYASKRALALSITVVLGLYIALLAANLGGKIDEVAKAEIIFAAQMIVSQDPQYRDLTAAERTRIARERADQMEEARGLNRSIFLRTAEWLPKGLTLQLGQSQFLRTITYRPPGEQRIVKNLILERIPNTLLLLGVTNLTFFLSSVWVGLRLSRSYRSWLDNFFVILSPLSAAPSWFYGLFLVAIFAGMLFWLPFGGMLPPIPPDTRWEYALEVGRHMILPFAAVFLSVFFYSVYLWRSFFLIYAGEDYVDMAQAKGLPQNLIDRRYILRPTLPTILTNLAFMLIAIWGGSIILERLFQWPGLGDLFYIAIAGPTPTTVRQDPPVIVGLIVIYAYFLAITIFILDLAYALLDPRVRIGGGDTQNKTDAAVAPSQNRFRFRPFNRTAVPGRPPLRERAPAAAGQWLLGIGGWFKELPQWTVQMSGQAKNVLWQISRYPSAMIGLGIIAILLGSIVYTVNAIPYQDAVRLWRASEADWQDVPRNARPVWFNYFSKTKQPETVVLDSRYDNVERTVEQLGNVTAMTLNYTFDFPYDGFPQEPILYFYPQFEEKALHVTMNWLTPDGREIRLGQLSPRSGQRYRFSEDSRLMRRINRLDPQVGLFINPNNEELIPLKGEYQLQIEAILFEDEANFDAKFILHGQVYGWAGTDNRRRDLSIALLWGTPIALSFGLLAAFSSTFLTMVIAAAGAWRGGWVDGLIQRITEVNLIIPMFPILAMFTAFFTLRIWEVLGIAILLSIFGSSIKTYRALFLQVKESPYVEAAQAYGAGHGRIILYYLTPRVLPVLIPQIMILVPTYVFLEAGLAFLGLSDLYLPTWGKVINEAHVNSALLTGQFYWILQPAFLLMLTAFAFAMLGFSLDRIFNPRLRDV